MNAETYADPLRAPRFLAGGGDLGARMRAHDWGGTPLGPPILWPQSLKTAVRIMLTSRQPIWVGWGPELIFFYNDAYRSIIGGKHPWALGRPTREVWREIWGDIGPMLDTALRGDEGTYVESQLLIMERSGYPEETYYTFSYSPVPDDDGRVGGIICANTDDTLRVIGERQLALLRELAVATADAHAVATACTRVTDALRTNARDLPFAMLYLCEPEGGRLALVGACGIEPGSPAALLSVCLDEPAPWPFAETLRDNAAHTVTDIGGRFGVEFACGAWKQPPGKAALIPIPGRGDTGQPGVLVVGLNPYRLFGDDYRRFLDLVAGEIGASIANAQAYEEERRRAEALAELDRAKTAFFSNVSHEFRTPLALILGPIEDALNERSPEMPNAPQRQRLELVHRNALRLLKLVNSLLDFSRIEAGRAQARYQPTDLAKFTAELASSFESAAGRADLTLMIECAPLPEPVYVDRDMWEKIVLNLISNAFKFTFEGGIEVGVRASGDGTAAELHVRDTGTGIPPEELPHMFERFHRVKNAKGRSFEGSGIGLALVKELAKQHGGSIAVASEPGQGTTFTVSIPFGHSHLPAEQVVQTEPQAAPGPRAGAYVHEALRWLPDAPPTAAPDWLSAVATDLGEDLNIAQAAGHHRVLLADDNQDMRDYIARLLQSKGYVVETVADGEAALAAARARPPDLILSDVMMPRLDGLGLLNALRQDPQLRDLPMILLSARAGEEARVGGLSAGADDYLSKPFSARELLARVASNLQLARIRGEAEAGLRQAQEDLSAALAASNTATYRWDAGTGEFISYDDNLKRLFGFGADEPVEQFDDFIRRIHPDDMPEIEVALAATRQGADFESEYRVVLPDGNMRWIYSRGKTIRDAGGAAVLVGACTDITDRKREEEHRERLLDELNHRVKNMLAIVQSLAMQTLRRAGGMEEARDALDARLLSLSRAHDVLTAEHWEGGDFETAVKNALEAWADAGPSGRFRMQGEPLRLRPKALLALSMALHELATNAVKYGALSNDTGYIDIHWEIMREEPRRFRLRWVERGGPAVVPPRRRGFGSRLIQQGLAIDVAGEVRLDFPHEGVVFALDAPLKEIQGRAAPR